MNWVVHFQVAADNIQRAVKFYREVFDWTIEKWDGPLEYWSISTGVHKEIGIDGAIIKRVLPAGSGTINTIAVKDIEFMLQKIITAGGRKFTEIELIPKIGKFCYCTDTEGNLFGMMQWIPSIES